MFIEEEGVYEEYEGVVEEGAYEEYEGVVEEGAYEGVAEEGEGEGEGEEVTGDGVYEDGVVEDNVIGGGVSGKKRVGYVSANNPSLHDNKIYCVVFHKTVHIIFFSFSSFIF